MRRTLVGAVLVSFLGLAACGDDGETSQSAVTDQSQKATQETALTKVGLDVSFGSGGIASVPMSATEPDRVTTATVGHDGKLYAAGFLNRGGDQQVAVMRVGSDGKLDPSFGTQGVASTNVSVGKTAEVARSIAMQSSGKLVVAGTAEHDATAAGDAARDTDIIAARFDASGELDRSFGTNGIARIDLGVGRAASPTSFTGDTAWGMVSLPDDKLVLFGTQLAPGADRTDADFVLIGLTNSGSLDPTFGSAGVARLDSPNSSENARGVIVHNDKLVATGYSRGQDGVVSPMLVRTSMSGKFDAAFGTNGVATGRILPGVAEAYALALQGDNYVLTGYGRGADANEKVDLLVYRFTANGQWDKTFGNDGLVRLDNAKEDDRGRDLAVLPNGRILVVGSGKQTAEKTQAMAVLLDPNGAAVNDFGTGGRILSDLGGPADSWFGVTSSTDRKYAYLLGYKGTDANSGGNDDAVIGRLTT